MRNLSVQADSSLQLLSSEALHEKRVSEARLLCLNYEANATYFIRDDTTVCHIGEEGDWEIDVAAEFPDEPLGRVSSLGLAVELEMLCLATSSGRLLSLDLVTKQLEEIGSLEGGVIAACWSPEGEIWVLVSGKARLIMLTKEFEVLADVALFSTPPKIVPSRQLPATEEVQAVHDAAVSWRGDGKFFATLSRTAEDASGVLRIWEKEGCCIHAVGEDTPGLTCALAWQPNGRHVFAARRQNGRHSVCLFERNGLGHGDFEVQGEIETLSWSCGSEYLAVGIRDSAAESGTDDSERKKGSGRYRAAQVWLRSNWHWYLKQEMRFPASRGLEVVWSEESPSTLRVLSREGELRTVEFGTATSVSSRGTAAVIDGCRLLVTPLQHTVVPPPLAAMTLAFPAPVQCVAFSDGADPEVLAATLSDGRIAIARSPEADYWEDEVPENSLEFPDDAEAAQGGRLQATVLETDLRGALCNDGFHIRSIAWTSQRSLLVIHHSEGQDQLLEFCFAVDPAQHSLPDRPAPLEPDPSSDPARLSEFPGSVMRFAGRVNSPGQGSGGWMQVVSCPGGGALLQSQSGQLYFFEAGPSDCYQSLIAHPAVGASTDPKTPHPPGFGDLAPLHSRGRLTPLANSFPRPCPLMLPVPAAPGGAGPSAFGVAANSQAFLGSLLVASGVTSAALRPGDADQPDFLLYVTKDSFLHTRPVSELVTGVGASDSAPTGDSQRPQRRRGIGEGKRGENHYTAMHAAMRGHGAAVPGGDILKARAVEQGSRIVAVPASGTSVVLQMPRGNLETIHPRSLVLPAVGQLVKAGAWGEAWQMAGVHRVDLNLLVDYAWPHFLRHAADFVREVPDDQDLVDLLTALRPESITAEGGIYAGLPGAEARLEELPEGEKVGLVCSALRDAMLAQSPETYLKPVLSSYTSQGLLEDALSLLKATKEAQLANSAPLEPAATADEGVSLKGQGALGRHRRRHAVEPPNAEEALAHVLLTTDAERLYRAALGMFELELAYMIVVNSQRDPGEYLFQLQQFSAKPEGPLRKHAVNLHLGRTSAALQNLLEAGDAHFDGALELARKEGKLRELLSLLGDEEDRAPQRRRALAEYGRWLSARDLREDAGLAFLAAGELHRALVEYKEGNHWQMALAVAGRLGYSPDERRELAEALVESLTESSQLSAAARIAAEHLRDGETAIGLLSQAREWREALRQAALFDRQDLVETTVSPAVADTASTLLEDLADTREKIGKYDKRLREVRSRKAALSAALEEAQDAAEDRGQFDDTASEGGLSSVVSNLSVYTQASVAASTAASTGIAPSTVGGRWPQKKRKKGRKGPKIKQGSPEEEAALVTHIHSLAPSAKQCEEAGQLAELLVLLGHEPDARKLQALMSSVTSEHKVAAEHAGTAVDASANATKPPTVDWKWDLLRPV